MPETDHLCCQAFIKYYLYMLICRNVLEKNVSAFSAAFTANLHSSRKILTDKFNTAGLTSSKSLSYQWFHESFFERRMQLNLTPGLQTQKERAMQNAVKPLKRFPSQKVSLYNLYQAVPAPELTTEAVPKPLLPYQGSCFHQSQCHPSHALCASSTSSLQSLTGCYQIYLILTKKQYLNTLNILL